ncbi:hypothetical protein QAD02_002392 [Eretmocerus hayati]|uniref:Uncharacterized protein n=1 Tax=Eretmocerus hayati TaxID=131215 RepID=A0ACC2NJZ6_9HYME|nr:hypothetical protein QAD02_002392 [Eretmocerus hayati]
MRTLLSLRISEKKLDQCEKNLEKFAENWEELFGPELMVFNIHLLLHPVSSVRRSGPMWTTSAFGFESEMGHLKDLVSGTTDVLEQVTTHILKCSGFSNNVLTSISEKKSFQLCKRMMSNEHHIIKHHGTKENAVVPYTEGELKRNKYHRCIYEKVMYYSTSHKRPQKTDDTFDELVDGRIVQINHFFLRNDKVYANV